MAPVNENTVKLGGNKFMAPFVPCWMQSRTLQGSNGCVEHRVVGAISRVVVAFIDKLALRSSQAFERLVKKRISLVLHVVHVYGMISASGARPRRGTSGSRGPRGGR